MGYRAIADDLHQRVKGREYEPGTRLPSYPELAALYSVSISTAQRAISLLVDRGVVITSPGRGLFVADDPPTT
jgi:DNA-binding GntR family transcriptional regulator